MGKTIVSQGYLYSNLYYKDNNRDTGPPTFQISEALYNELEEYRLAIEKKLCCKIGCSWYKLNDDVMDIYNDPKLCDFFDAKRCLSNTTYFLGAYTSYECPLTDCAPQKKYCIELDLQFSNDQKCDPLKSKFAKSNGIIVSIKSCTPF